MSHNLVKLIDISLIPATLLVVGKIVGLAVAINIFQLPWTLVELPDSLLAVRPLLLSEDVTTASTYSDIIMYMCLAVGFSFILVQALFLHETHIKPTLLVRLSNNNLLGLVRSSFDIYHTAAIWLVFIWLCSLLVWINVLAQKTELWVGIVTVVANIIFTALVFQDVYREIEDSRHNLGKQIAF